MRQAMRAVAFVLMTAAAAAAPSRPAAKAHAANAHWVTSWATAQQIVEPANMLAPADLTDTTLRQIVRLSVGGSAYRLVLSNAFGTAPLHLTSVHVARALAADAIDPASDRAVVADITIPAGAAWVSDAIAMPVAPLADLAISIHYDTAPVVQTGHPGSRQTSYVLAGDHVAEARLTGAKTADHWYQIAAVEVLAAPKVAAVVVLGDSITDGRGSTTNGNDRWTNILAERLPAKPGVAVLNAGQGGNCLLSQCLGPNALSRLERDVFTPPGVTRLIVLEGINDLGRLAGGRTVAPEEHAAVVAHLIAGYQQIAVRAHAHRLKIYIGTITPYMGSASYHPDAANEADRTAVNAWIRAQKLFDGVIDFDTALQDPLRPHHLNPSYDSGDLLHPSAAGYRVMGELAAKVLTAPKAKGKKKK